MRRHVAGRRQWSCRLACNGGAAVAAVVEMPMTSSSARRRHDYYGSNVTLKYQIGGTTRVPKNCTDARSATRRASIAHGSKHV